MFNSVQNIKFDIFQSPNNPNFVVVQGNLASGEFYAQDSIRLEAHSWSKWENQKVLEEGIKFELRSCSHDFSSSLHCVDVHSTSDKVEAEKVMNKFNEFIKNRKVQR